MLRTGRFSPARLTLEGTTKMKRLLPDAHLLPWLLILLFLAWASPSAASSDDALGKLDLQLRQQIEGPAAAASALRLSQASTSAPDAGALQVFVTGDLDAALLRACGAEPGTVLPGVATARIPLSRVLELASSPRVTHVAATRPMSLLLDENRLETRARLLWGGDPPQYSESGYAGYGVVVGIIDTGIDWSHPDFKNTDGTTRIRYIWDQAQYGSPPSGFTYGTEFTAAQINAGQCTSYDIDGHGTHIAGAAAGNGRATGNGQPQYLFVGMAPRAEIVVVKAGATSGTITDANVLDAVSYVFQKATTLGMNAVVCISLGTQSGPHDGTAPLDLGLDALSGPGRIIVAAAGNEGQTNIHSALSLARGATGTSSLRVPTYNPNYSERIEVEGWFDQASNFSVKLISPSGYTLGPAVEGNSLSSTTADGWASVYMPSSTSGPQQVQIQLAAVVPSTAIKAGDWRLEVTAIGTPSGPIDFWITDYSLSNQKPTMVLGQSAAKCIASPASATKVIAATAYSAKTTWTAVNGQTCSFPGTADDIAPFSSQGPRRDGVQKPDIAASGNGLAAALDTRISVGQSLKAIDGVHYMRYGTSVAAAVTAGAVALFLDETPGLDPTGIRTVLQQRATKDSYTTQSVPNSRWGYGKLAVAPAVTGVEPLLGELSFRAPYPNPTSGSAYFEFSLSAADLEAPGTQVRLRIIDARGRQVASLTGEAVPGNQRFDWDGYSSDGRVVPAGLYFARLEVGSKMTVRRFVRIQ